MKSSILPFKRGLWVSGRKVSKLFFLLFLSCLFAFNSCTNIFETSVEETTEERQEQPAAGQTPAPIVTQPSAVKVSFSGSLSMRGAVPSQIDQAVANQNTQELETSYQEELEASLSILQRLARAVRSASPSVAAGGNYEFFVKAFTNDGAEPQEVTPTQDASGQYTYAFLLEPGHIWYFTAGFRRNAIGIQGQTGYEPERILMLDLDSQRNAPFYHDFTNMDDLSSQHTFILGPVQSEEGKGSLNLELTVDTSKVDNFKLFIPDATDGHPVEWNADGKVHITEDGTTAGKWYIKSDGLDSESHNVPSGTYNLSIIFYKQFIPTGGSTADAYNTPVYISYQTINVFDNMTTNLWMNENDDSSSASTAINKTTHAFNVSQTLVENFTNTSLYVGRPVQSNITPNDEAVGGPFSPLATLEQAFNLIEARGRGAPYRIYVSGTQEGSFTVPAAITSAMASSIEITTASGNPQATLDAATTGGSVLTVNSAVPLKISNLKITGGNAGSGNGGGINIPSTNTSARVTLDTGALITGNSAAHGDGVYVGGGSLILQGSPKVEEDDDICLAAGKTITAKQLTGSEHIANITQENWTRHSTIITGSSLSNSVANRFNLTANADDEWQKFAAPNQITIYAPIYVGSGGDDSAENSGTKTHPFESFTRACGEMNDATKNWDININGTVNGAQTIAAAVSSGAASITIQGVSALSGGNPQDKIDAGSNGSALTIATSVPVTIKKLLITGGNKSGDGGGINVTAANAELYLANDVQIYGNEATGNGGGINLGGTGAKLFMYSNSLIGEPGISITSSQQAAEAGSFGNKAANGGGIYIGGSGAAAYIGATGLASNGDVVPEGTNGVFCKIYRNYSTNGGGIYNAAGIVKLCNKLNINYNRASDSGGGLYIGAGASESRSEGGSLYKNAAVNGGGLYICDGAVFTLDGGIGGNGSSYYNTATNGGAVYNAGTFKLESNAFLCYGYSAGTNDVYLANVGGVQKTITLATESFTQPSLNVVVTIPDWLHGRGKQILSTNEVTLNSTVLSKVKTSENGWEIKTNDSNTAATIESPIYVASEGTRYKCSAAPSDDGASGSSSKPFKTIAAACVLLEASDTDYEIKIDGEIAGSQTIPDTIQAKSLTLSGSNTNLVHKIVCSYENPVDNGSALTVNTTVPVLLKYLCIEGGSTTGNGGGINIIKEQAKVGLNSYVYIQKNQAVNGGGVYVCENATLFASRNYVYIGSVNQNSPSDQNTEKSTGINVAENGGGIYCCGKIEFGSTLKTDGTKTSSSYSNLCIYGNVAEKNGGGIYSTGTAGYWSNQTYPVMYSYAGEKGGGMYVGAGTMDIRGLQIQKNESVDGGGVYVESGASYTLAGTTLENNTASASGGGVYNAGSFTLGDASAGSIKSNSAVNGGGVYNAGGAEFDLWNGTIGGTNSNGTSLNNTAGSGGNGGAVYVSSSSTFKIKTPNGKTATIPYGGSVNVNDVYLEKGGTDASPVYATITLASANFTAGVTITASEWKRGVPVLTKDTTTITDTIAAKFSFTDGGWNNTVYNSGNNSKIDAPIYVAGSDKTKCTGTPTDTNNTIGNAAHPFASIAGALSLIKDKNTDYTIEIDGTIKSSQELPATLTDGSDGDTDYMAKSLLLKGTNGLDSSTQIPKDSINTSANGKGRVLAVYAKKVPVTIQNLLLTGAEIDGSGGGIYINGSDTSLILSDGAVVNGNTAVSGGGVYLYSGNLYLNGTAVVGKPGTVSSCAGTTSGTYANKATLIGGGIAIEQGTLWLGYRPPQQTEIQPQTIATTGGVIYNLVASSSGACHGGGIDNNQGTVHFAKGNVKYNYAHGPQTGDTDVGSGGGISTAYTFNLSGDAVISDNKAADGGGVYITTNGTSGNLVMTGGTISSNVAERTGGAIYQGGTFTVSGSAHVYPGSLKTNDVYLKSEKVVSIEGTYNGSGNTSTSKMALTPENWTRGSNVIAGSGCNLTNVTYFNITDSEWRILNDDTTDKGKIDADIWVASSLTTGHNRTTGVSAPPSTASERRGTKAAPYQTITEAANACWSSNRDFIINVTGKVNDNVRHEIASTVTAKSITITGARGNTYDEINRGLTATANKGNVLKIATAVPVTIKDLKITGGYSTNTLYDADGGGIYVSAKGASLTLASGALITGNTSTNGGGVYIEGSSESGGKANLYMISGSQVSGNKAASAGGGVYLSYANLCMTGTALVGSTADSAAATATDGDSPQHSNWASNGSGGGVYASNGGVYMGYKTASTESSAEESLSNGIGYNYASQNGGGLFLASGGVLYMKTGYIRRNGTIINVSSNGQGGGVCVYDGATVSIQGGTIGSNAATQGGGIYFANNNTVAAGTISGNTASASGGGIYIAFGKTVTLQAVALTENATTSTGSLAAYYGGGVHNAGTLQITGASSFTGNYVSTSTSNAYGGAIANQGTSSSIEISGSVTMDGNYVRTTATNGKKAFGGAIYNGGTLTMSAGTIGTSSLNYVTAASGSIAQGGAIYQYGRFNANGALNFNNSGNAATQNDVYIVSASNAVNITGPMGSASITVTPYSYAIGIPIARKDGGCNINVFKSAIKKFKLVTSGIYSGVEYQSNNFGIDEGAVGIDATTIKNSDIDTYMNGKEWTQNNGYFSNGLNYFLVKDNEGKYALIKSNRSSGITNEVTIDSQSLKVSNQAGADVYHDLNSLYQYSLSQGGVTVIQNICEWDPYQKTGDSASKYYVTLNYYNGDIISSVGERIWHYTVR